MVKWSLQLPTWKNYFKAITKNISYTVESQEKSYYYLVDCHDIAKEVCDELDLEFDRLPISPEFNNLLDGFTTTPSLVTSTWVLLIPSRICIGR